MTNLRISEPEKWKDVSGYEGLYRVSSLGKFENIPRGFVTFRGNPKRRYVEVDIAANGYKGRIGLHRLIAKEFVPNPNNYSIVNHLDNDSQNNAACNLEWTDQKGNINHAIRIGVFTPKWNTLQKSGAEHYRARPVFQKDANGIIIKEWPCISLAAKDLKINDSGISACLSRRQKTYGGFIWEYVPKEVAANGGLNENETWIDIPFYEGLYQVSDLGNVRSIKKTIRILTPQARREKDGKRYLSLKLCKHGMVKHFLVHRLVLLAFEGQMPIHFHVVRHLNDNPQDNRLLNLAYGTSSENIKESYVKGRSKPKLIQLREMNNKSNLKKQKSIIRIAIETGEMLQTASACQMAKQTRTSAAQVIRYCRNRMPYEGKYLFQFTAAS